MTWKIVEICRLLDEMLFFVIYMKRILVSSENNYLSWRGESWFNTQNHLAHNWLFIQYNNQHLNNLKVFVHLYKLIDAFFRGSYKNRKILFLCLIRFFLKYVSIQSKLYEYKGILLPSRQVVSFCFLLWTNLKMHFLCYKMHAVLRTNNTIQAQWRQNAI